MTTICVVCSDLHFTLNAPVARSVEPDWLQCIERQFSEVKKFCQNRSAPLLIAGDIFDKWNPPVELVNFTIDLLRGIEVYAIPGQHDLPQHRYDARDKAGYGTLVRAGSIRDVVAPIEFDDWVLYAAPWNQKIPDPTSSGSKLKILIGHRYVWAGSHSYPGAPSEGESSSIKEETSQFDLSFWGDNHKGFSRNPVYNCGGFFRRKSDEFDYAPRFYAVDETGLVKTVMMDVSSDRFIEKSQVEIIREESERFEEFLCELRSVETDAIDFKEELLRGSRQEREGVQNLIVSFLERM